MVENRDKRVVRCVGGDLPHLVIHGPDLPEWMRVSATEGWRLDLSGDEPVYRWES